MVARKPGGPLPGRPLAAACLAAALLLASCNIFSPRQSEPPDLTANADPLHFSSILNGTSKVFLKLQYEDLFTDDLLYTDNNSQSYAKAPLIQRLKQIPLSYEGIQVLWKPGVILDRGDTLNLNGLQYLIYLTGSTGVPANDSGNADFTVAKNSQAEWHICAWRDFPAAAGKSFFAP